jgi:hypothetical protein
LPEPAQEGEERSVAARDIERDVNQHIIGSSVSRGT